MYFSLKGRIIYIKNDYIVIEVNDVGYKVFVGRVNRYKIGDIYKIYIYQVVKEDEIYLVGFDSLDEKSIFTMLISVKGIGPKSALAILSSTTPQALITAIKSNNIAFLRKIPGIGHKAAAQILLDLRGTLHVEKETNINQYDEVKAALRTLKFKVKEIDDVLADISIPNASNEVILKEALKRLEKRNG